MSNNSSMSSKLSIYSKDWEKRYPIKEEKSDKYAFFCIPCGVKVSCTYSGVHSVIKHCNTIKHTTNVEKQTQGTEDKDSTGDETVESSFTSSISENTRGKQNSTTSQSSKNQRRSSAILSNPSGSGTRNIRKRFGTPKQDSEMKPDTNTHDNHKKVMALLTQCKIKYGIEFSEEFSKDFDLNTDENLSIAVKGIKEGKSKSN
ncbi:hypothetical protein RF11_13074 [Thelohanellus kitauei]|uniref:Uncharacterized protein n=1 Tax=Thelohanellus kitauei TaxID=669202 RepID=A0A0C2JKC9_THEKT|nr:hypothetical protein RF11_13074 [Thelohanellus kitauei]